MRMFMYLLLMTWMIVLMDRQITRRMKFVMFVRMCVLVTMFMGVDSAIWMLVFMDMGVYMKMFMPFTFHL